jgi:Skp family chaperone for outer membrane proteins
MYICIYYVCTYLFFSTVNRDEAQNKMLALKEKADKEMSQYNTELKELARIIDHDRKLRQFMSRKDQERTEAHEEMEAMKRKREAEKSSEREGTVMVCPIVI